MIDVVDVEEVTDDGLRRHATGEEAAPERLTRHCREPRGEKRAVGGEARSEQDGQAIGERHADRLGKRCETPGNDPGNSLGHAVVREDTVEIR